MNQIFMDVKEVSEKLGVSRSKAYNIIREWNDELKSMGSIEERIENIDERLEQLKNQKKELLAKQREQDRKARTRRLIERGAILE